MRALRSICSLLILFGLIACGSPSQQPTSVPTAISAGNANILTIGAVNSSPSKRIKAMQPMADYLTSQLTPVGIDKVNIKIAANTDDMSTMVQNGEVDVFFDTAYTALIIGEQTQAKPVLRWWKDGQAEYHSVFLTQADSHITTLDQLQGSVIAFEQPFSTSGYFVPKTYLAQQNYKLHEIADAKFKVEHDTIG